MKPETIRAMIVQDCINRAEPVFVAKNSDDIIIGVKGQSRLVNSYSLKGIGTDSWFSAKYM